MVNVGVDVEREIGEAVTLVAALADVARAKGAKTLDYAKANCSVHLEMGAPPTDPKPALTDEERKVAEAAGKLAARRAKLRSLLGREPTDEEMTELP